MVFKFQIVFAPKLETGDAGESFRNTIVWAGD